MTAVTVAVWWSNQRIDVAATSEPPCECRWWDSDGDRCEWIPCGEHAELLVRDVLK